MVDICIYTTPEVLEHKQDKLKNDEDKSDCGKYYWEFSRMPRRTKVGEKIYFATKGFIRGYFIICDQDYDALNSFTFKSETWKNIKPIPTKPFQGFKYTEDKK